MVDRPQIRGLLLDGRVFVDLQDLVAHMRRRARWWRAETQADRVLGDDTELTEEEFHLAVAGRAIAAELEDRADQLDVEGVKLVSELADAAS